MTSVSLNQFLMLFMWFPLASLLLLLLLIARFFEKFSGQRTYFRLYTLVIVLFGAAMVRYASVDRISGDLPGDVLMGTAGVLLALLSLHLLRLMVWRQGGLPDHETDA